MCLNLLLPLSGGGRGSCPHGTWMCEQAGGAKGPGGGTPSVPRCLQLYPCRSRFRNFWLIAFGWTHQGKRRGLEEGDHKPLVLETVGREFGARPPDFCLCYSLKGLLTWNLSRNLESGGCGWNTSPKRPGSLESPGLVHPTLTLQHTDTDAWLCVALSVYPTAPAWHLHGHQLRGINAGMGWEVEIMATKAFIVVITVPL